MTIRAKLLIHGRCYQDVSDKLPCWLVWHSLSPIQEEPVHIINPCRECFKIPFQGIVLPFVRTTQQILTQGKYEANEIVS